MQLRPNDILGERLRLERLIGEGGMGAVWCAYDLRKNERVALKFLRGSGSIAAKKRFFREARASSAVAHPNVVRVHEVLVGPDGMPMMLMDYLEGESLGARLEREIKLPLDETVRILAQVISAIGTAHAKGIVHRDLKPDNIYLCKGAGPDDVRVLDFGVAKLTAADGEAMATAGLTATGAVIGTPYYMSPEQVFADKTIDHRADIWSLGIILYECLAGKKPLSGDSIGALLRSITNGDMTKLRTLEPSLPEPIYELVDRMIETDREKRPKDLREVFEVLGAYLPTKKSVPFGEATNDGSLSFDDTIPSDMMLVQSTNDGSATTKNPAPAKRARGSIAIVGVIAVLVAGGIGGGFAWKRAQDRATRPDDTVVNNTLNPTIATSTASFMASVNPNTPPPPSAPPSASAAPSASGVTRLKPQPWMKPSAVASAPSSAPSTTPTASIAKPIGPAIVGSNPYQKNP